MAKLANKSASKREVQSKRRKAAGAKPQKTKSQKIVAEPACSAQPKADTKAARVIAMLQSPAGATTAAMTQETGWQAHSVRGFLAGVVRKKLKLNLVSGKTGGQRIYRILVDAPPDAPARAGKRRSG